MYKLNIYLNVYNYVCLVYEKRKFSSQTIGDKILQTSARLHKKERCLKMKIAKYAKIITTVLIGAICVIGAFDNKTPTKCETPKEEIKEVIKEKLPVIKHKKNSMQLTY